MKRCECLKAKYTRDARGLVLTGHHENCPERPNPLECAYQLISDLARGGHSFGNKAMAIADLHSLLKKD